MERYTTVLKNIPSGNAVEPLRGWLAFPLLCLALLVSCTADLASDTRRQPGGPLRFEAPVVALPTRSVNIAENDAKFPTTWHFTVSAIKHEGDFSSWSAGETYIEHQDCGYNEVLKCWDSETSTDPKTYLWPHDGKKLSFQAFSPTAWGATIGEDGVSCTDYTFATDGTQPDLMYSDRTINMTKSEATTQYITDESTPGVQLQFHHALCSFRFTVKKSEEYAGNTFVLTNILLKNIYTEGSFAQHLSDNNSASSPAWTPKSGAQPKNNFSLLHTEHTVEAFSAEDPDPLDSKTYDVLVMPQEINNALAIQVEYTFQQGDGTPIRQSQSVLLKDAVFSNSDPRFGIGKQYTFHIIIEKSKVRFEPIVCDEWKDHIIADLEATSKEPAIQGDVENIVAPDIFPTPESPVIPVTP